MQSSRISHIQFLRHCERQSRARQVEEKQRKYSFPTAAATRDLEQRVLRRVGASRGMEPKSHCDATGAAVSNSDSSAVGEFICRLAWHVCPFHHRSDGPDCQYRDLTHLSTSTVESESRPHIDALKTSDRPKLQFVSPGNV